MDTNCPSNTKSRDSTEFHHNSPPLPNQSRRTLPGVEGMKRVSAETQREDSDQSVRATHSEQRFQPREQETNRFQKKPKEALLRG